MQPRKPSPRRARLEKITEVADLFSDLQQLGVLDPSRWIEVLESASSDDFAWARRLVRAVTLDFADVVSAIELLQGTDAFGWGHFRRQPQECGVFAREKVVLTAGCLLLRPLVESDAVSSFVDVVTSVAPDARRFLSLMNQTDGGRAGLGEPKANKGEF